MLTFPTLDTGAVAQFPLPLSYTIPVQVIRFIDGSDQRFLDRATALRTWHIELASINEDELRQIEDFFAGLGGQVTLFSFPDPYSGQLIPNCLLGGNSLVSDYLETDLTSTSFWVLETKGLANL